MSRLRELELSETTIKYIINSYNEDVIDNIDIYIDDIKQNIIFLRSIGINNIEELLKTDITIFFQPVSDTKEVVNEIGLEKTINMLLEDSECIRYLLK